MTKGTPEWKEANLEQCKQDILALAGNPFVQDAKMIQWFCNRDKVDIGVGLDIYINEFYTNEERELIDEEHIKQWKEVNRKYFLNYIVEVQKAMILNKDAVPFAEE